MARRLDKQTIDMLRCAAEAYSVNLVDRNLLFVTTSAKRPLYSCNFYTSNFAHLVGLEAPQTNGTSASDIFSNALTGEVVIQDIDFSYSEDFETLQKKLSLWKNTMNIGRKARMIAESNGFAKFKFDVEVAMGNSVKSKDSPNNPNSWYVGFKKSPTDGFVPATAQKVDPESRSLKDTQGRILATLSRRVRQEQDAPFKEVMYVNKNLSEEDTRKINSLLTGKVWLTSNAAEELARQIEQKSGLDIDFNHLVKSDDTPPSTNDPSSKEIAKEAPPQVIDNPFDNVAPGTAMTPAENMAAAKKSAIAQRKARGIKDQTKKR